MVFFLPVRPRFRILKFLVAGHTLPSQGCQAHLFPCFSKSSLRLARNLHRNFPHLKNIINNWIGFLLLIANWNSLVAQTVKRLPAMSETWVRSLGLENPLGKEMATQSSILAWEISQTEEPGGLQSMGSQRVGTH